MKPKHKLARGTVCSHLKYCTERNITKMNQDLKISGRKEINTIVLSKEMTTQILNPSSIFFGTVYLIHWCSILYISDIMKYIPLYTTLHCCVSNQAIKKINNLNKRIININKVARVPPERVQQNIKTTAKDDSCIWNFSTFHILVGKKKTSGCFSI